MVVTVDDDTLLADGSDATRLVVRVTDEFGADRPLASGVVTFGVQGPLTVVGENPAAFVGGVAAVWLRATHDAGEAVVVVTSPLLGSCERRIRVQDVAPDPW
jgi:beta-galactosidase